MSLIEGASKAFKIRNALINFAAACPMHATEIEKSITVLSSLSLTLYELNELVKGGSNVVPRRIRDKLEAVQSDIMLSLSSAWRCIGGIDRGLTAEDYRRTWEDLTAHSETMTGESLHSALYQSQKTLHDLIAALRDVTTIEQSINVTPDLTYGGDKAPLVGVKCVSQPQQPLDRPSLSRPAKQRSYERTRNAGPKSPLSPQADHLGHREKFPPTPPLSPVFSQESSDGSDASRTSSRRATGLTRIATFTWLPPTHEITRYHEPTSITKEHYIPDEQYEVVARYIFSKELQLVFMRRSTDCRIKLVCHYITTDGLAEYSCLPVTDLQIARSTSMLRIYRVDQYGMVERWISIKLSSYEDMVLLANTFIVLRGQDESEGSGRLRADDEHLQHEVCEYSCRIEETNLYCTLQILLDMVTGSIRLQALKSGGRQTRTPVWTAFVTDLIADPDWCQVIDKSTVMVSKVRVYSFSVNSKPRHSFREPFLLNFVWPRDVIDFVKSVDALRERQGHY